MMKLNAILFAAGLSVDLNDEMNDLYNLVLEARSDETKIDEAVGTYRHLSSFLKGIDYILDYFEHDEEQEQMKQLSDTNWHDELQRHWAPIMELKWSRELGRKVDIVTLHRDGGKSWQVTVEDERREFDRQTDLRDWLKSLKD